MTTNVLMNARIHTVRAVALLAVVSASPAHADKAPAGERLSNEQNSAKQAASVSFERGDDSLRVLIRDQTVGEYVFKDDSILRPYFRHLKTPSGVQVTRTHPPIQGQDLDDHPTMHPGLWLGFGLLNDADFWRNQGRVRHIKFNEEPNGVVGQGGFAVRNVYESEAGVICTEDCEIAILVRPDGYLIDWRSTFHSDKADFTFGDQEEMGLGVRVATPLAVVKQGKIIDSEGRKNESEIWGRQADWCEYGGVLEGKRVGVALMPDPGNFRRSWFHARDYGVLVANPFGRNAFTKEDKSSVTVKQGEKIRLAFGVLVYEVPQEESLDISAAYRQYVENVASSTQAENQ